MIGLVVLQFDQVSVTAVGVLIGVMFLLFALQQFAIAAVAPSLGWLSALFGVLFVVAGVIALISPGNTFTALADVLGFLFLLVGTFWIIQAFVESDFNELWWVAGAAFRHRDGRTGVLDVGPALHHEGVCAAGVRGDLGAHGMGN